MDKGKIIFLTGVPSSGKTSLARVLQAKLCKHYYWISRDTFTDDMAPETKKENDWPEIYQTCCNLHNHSIKLFSDIGVNVIVDCVMLHEDNNYVNLLYGYPILFIHVTCSSITELRRREAERGDRGIGQGESQLANISPNIIFDATVDTFENTIDECANEIIKLINDQ